MPSDIGLRLGIKLQFPPKEWQDQLDAAAAKKARLFDLRAGPFVRGELSVVSFVGEESGLNALYSYEVTFVTDVGARELQMGVQGMPACLALRHPELPPRVVQGLVAGLEVIGAYGQGAELSQRIYRMSLVPRLWLLTRRKKSRVFQDVPVSEIVERLLKPLHIAFEWRAEARNPLPFCYQRGETDFDFLTRILAVAGISFCFEHADGVLSSLTPEGAATAFAGTLLTDMIGEDNPLDGFIDMAVGTTKVVFFDDAAQCRGVGFAGGVAGRALDAANEALGELSNAATNALSIALGLHLKDPAPTFPFGGGLSSTDERVLRFSLRRNLRAKRVTVHEHLVTAHKDHQATATAPIASVAMGAGGGLGAAAASLSFGMGGLTGAASLLGGADDADFFDVMFEPPFPDAETLSVEEYDEDPEFMGTAYKEYNADPVLPALRALDQLRHDSAVGAGVTNSHRLSPGRRFVLSGHAAPECNREWLVRSIRCQGFDPEFSSGDSPVPFTYQAEFTAVPAVGGIRPPKPAPLQRPGLEIATVIGQPGQDVLCDQHGRVKVRFHWALSQDEYRPQKHFRTNHEIDYTCWVPVSSLWAGPGFGAQFVPRIGMEVIVGFLGEQGERPVVMGCLYTAENATPFVTPQRVGFRTKASPTRASGSEISIDDLDGSERVYVHAARDLDEEVVRNRTSAINGAASTRVGKHAELRVGGSNELAVGADHHMAVGGAVREASSEREMKVRGHLRTLVTGRDVRASAAGHTREVRGDDSLTVSGSANVRVSGNRSERIEGNALCVVGQRNHERELLTHVWGTYGVHANEIHITAETKIRLGVGETSLEINGDQLRALAGTLLLGGDKAVVSGSGASLSLTDKMVAQAAEARVMTTNSQLELAAAATITASSIKLKSGSGASADKDQKAAAKDESRSVRVRLAGPDGTAFKSRTVEVIAPGFFTKTTTDDDGLLSVDVPKATTMLQCQVWFGDYPTSPSHVFLVNLDEVPPIDTPKGLLTRLKHLGFYAGPLDALWGDEGASALYAFQISCASPDIDPSGEPDDNTKSALIKAHGS